MLLLKNANKLRLLIFMKSELSTDQREQKNISLLMKKMMSQMMIFEIKKMKMMQKIQKMKKFSKIIMKQLMNQLQSSQNQRMQIQVRKNLISRNCQGQVLVELDGNLKNLICEKLSINL